ncbi:MAG: hypothetical protein WD278_19095 [Pirellulales bacterium]
MDRLPDELRHFIAANINSVAQLELLLLLRGSPHKDWCPEEVSRALYTTTDMMAAQLAELEGRGLLTSTQQGRYRYAPGTPELAAIVDQVAKLYKERRVSVISTIYAEPTEKVRTFADAFRLRKD